MPQTKEESDLIRRYEEEGPAKTLVAPHHSLKTTASLAWIKAAIEDFRRAPYLSLLYGSIMALISAGISLWAWYVGSFTLVIILFAGFVFMGPALAIALYSVSYQLERGQKPSMLFCLKQCRQRLGNQMIFAGALLIVFLIWARAASMVNIFIPIKAHPAVVDVLEFLVIGSAIGSVFALIIFCASAFSLPMLMDKQVDSITAMLSSFNAVLNNKRAMFLWGVIIILALLVGFLTAFLALPIVLPLIGYASWHGYKQTLITDKWPPAPDPMS